MSIRVVIVLIAGAYTVAALGAQARTTADGVYTEAQAKRGDAAYAKSCAGCHGPDLLGEGQAASLVGKDFNSGWTDMSMDDLFQRIRTSMPADAPGSLKAADVTDIMTFMLSKGGFPSGQTELPTDSTALKQLKFIAPK